MEGLEEAGEVVGNMRPAEIKDDHKYSWTNHVKGKMQHYALSPSVVKRVIRAPKRMEEGVAPGTIAVMQPRGNKQITEIWVMYQKLKGDKKRIITAWRYPGVSPVRDQIPVPADIRDQLEDLLIENES